MTTEISFGVVGRETKQAFFIQDTDWDKPLSEIRPLVQEQDLFVPSVYRFLTLSGNVITEPSEGTLLLKDIIKKAERSPEDNSNSDEVSDVGDSKHDISTPFELLVTSANVKKCRFVNHLGDKYGIRKTISSIFDDHDSLGMLMKVAFVFMSLAIIIFAVIASLTLTIHVLLKVFASLRLSVYDLNAMSGGDGGSSETVSSLQVKLNSLEMSTKYETERLSQRLMELEDLYLKDLAVHKKELSMLKKEMHFRDAGYYSGDEDSVHDTGKEDMVRRDGFSYDEDRNKKSKPTKKATSKK